MKTTDILLIRALGPETKSLPLGLLYMQSYLRKFGYTAKIFDRYKNRSIDALKSELDGVSLVGISAMSIQSADAIYLSNLIRKWYGNKIKIIMGGNHFTALPWTAKKYADHVFIGEAEVSLKNFLDNGAKSDNFVIPSVPLENLDDIPQFSMKEAKRLLISKHDLFLPTSRGCPYRCNFCFGSEQRQGGLRYHSVKHMMKLMRSLVDEVKINSFYICDDIFVLSPKRVYEFCDALDKNNLSRLSYKCFTHSGHGNLALYSRMRQAGFKTMVMGVEHGNNRLLKYCGKRTTTAIIEQTCKTIFDAGLQLHLTYILGNLTETNKTITETVDFGIYLHKKFQSSSWFSFMQPLPGSAAFTDARKYGRIIDPDLSNFFNRNPTYLPKGVSIRHLINERKRGMKKANFSTMSSMSEILKYRLNEAPSMAAEAAINFASGVIAKYDKNSIQNELKRVKAVVGPVVAEIKANS